MYPEVINKIKIKEPRVYIELNYRDYKYSTQRFPAQDHLDGDLDLIPFIVYYVRTLFLSKDLEHNSQFRVGRDAKFLPGIYYEERWDQDILEFRKEINIKHPPSLK